MDGACGGRTLDVVRDLNQDVALPALEQAQLFWCAFTDGLLPMATDPRPVWIRRSLARRPENFVYSYRETVIGNRTQLVDVPGARTAEQLLSRRNHVSDLSRGCDRAGAHGQHFR